MFTSSIIPLFSVLLIADTQEKLQDRLPEVKEASDAKGLTINVENTKVLVISYKPQASRCNARVNGKIVKVMKRFCYLGSYSTEDGRCNEGIEIRSIFQKTRNILSNGHLSI